VRFRCQTVFWVCLQAKLQQSSTYLLFRVPGASSDCRLSQAEQHARPLASAVSPSMSSHQTEPVLNLSLVILHCSPEDVGQPNDTVLHPGLQLMQQHLTLSGRKLTLVVPRSIDAVLDMYIARSKLPKTCCPRWTCCAEPTQCVHDMAAWMRRMTATVSVSHKTASHGLVAHVLHNPTSHQHRHCDTHLSAV